MVEFTATILQFREQGEKTGWTYIEIPAAIAQQLKPGNKKSFRVKGMLDNYAIKGIALLPMGGGDFIMALNAAMRKGTGKRKGVKLNIKLEADDGFEIKAPAELMECMRDEPMALAYFNSLTKGHQGYFIKWINEAKTEQTRTKRIAQTVNALAKKFDFGLMLRELKKQRDELSG